MLWENLSDVVKVAIISAVPGTLGIFVGLLNNIIARRTERHALEAKSSAIEAKVTMSEAKTSIDTIQRQTNGLSEKLVEAAGKAGFQAGVHQEKEHSKDILEAVKVAQQPTVMVIPMPAPTVPVAPAATAPTKERTEGEK